LRQKNRKTFFHRSSRASISSLDPAAPASRAKNAFLAADKNRRTINSGKDLKKELIVIPGKLALAGVTRNPGISAASGCRFSPA
jgi:hypothetical protein